MISRVAHLIRVRDENGVVGFVSNRGGVGKSSWWIRPEIWMDKIAGGILDLNLLNHYGDNLDVP